MSMNHHCTGQYGVEPACHWLSHNDGTPNDIAAWNAWVEACRPDVDKPWSSGASMKVCRGRWALEPGQAFGIPYAYRYIVQGDGQEVSWLGSPLVLEGAAATRVQGLAIETDATGAHDAALKLYGSYAPGGHPADRCQIVDVQVIAHGQLNQGALVLQACSDVVIDRSRILNYSTGVASPTLYSQGQSGLHITGHTELHNLVPNADVISLNGCGRLTMDSDLVGSEADPATHASGRAYVGLAGQCGQIAFNGGQLYSDNGNAPQHLFYQQPGSYLDGVRIGPEVTVQTRDALFGGAVNYGPNVDVQATWLGRPTRVPRPTTRIVRGRLYTGRDSLDTPAVGCVYGGRPGPRQTRVLFDPPFSDVPTVTATVEWGPGLSNAGVNVVAPDQYGVTFEAWPIDLEIQFTAIGTDH
jgi:hypothetical protein